MSASNVSVIRHTGCAAPGTTTRQNMDELVRLQADPVGVCRVALGVEGEGEEAARAALLADVLPAHFGRAVAGKRGRALRDAVDGAWAALAAEGFSEPDPSGRALASAAEVD